MANRWQVESWKCGESDTYDQEVYGSRKKALEVARKWSRRKNYDIVEVYDVKESQIIYYYNRCKKKRRRR